MNGAYFYPDIPEGEERDGFAHSGGHFIASWFAPIKSDSYPHLPRIEIG
jgi:hypothetical protein